METPRVNLPLLKTTSASKSLPVPIHPLNRRGPFARRDKLVPFPRTSLYSPKGLFDLHISDSDCDDDKQIGNECCKPLPGDDSFVSVITPQKGANFHVHAAATIANSQPYTTANSNELQPSIVAPLGGTSAYSPAAQIEIIGDHLLANITPNLSIDVPCHTGQIPANHPFSCDPRSCIKNENVVVSSTTNFNGRKRLRELCPQGVATGGSKKATINDNRVMNVESDKASLDCVVLGEAKGDYKECVVPLSMPGAFRSDQNCVPFLPQGFNTIGPIPDAPPNGSSRSRSAYLVDQMYNNRNVFIQESGPDTKPFVREQTTLNRFKSDVSTTQNCPAAEVNYVGGNWIDVQKRDVHFPLTIVHLRFY